MAFALQNISGKKFNRLTVVKYVGRTSHRSSLYECVCDCGSIRVIRADALKNGKTVSCGCFNREQAARNIALVNELREPFRFDLAGQRFGRLVVIEHVQGEYSSWKCICDCGKNTTVRACSLKAGFTTSCGCAAIDARRESTIKRNTTHGLTDAPEYSNWKSMLSRCFNPNETHYRHYGGRGIKPCEFIRATPLNLILCLGRKPTLAHELDKIKNSMGYWCGSCAECLEKGQPLNIRWATHKQQMRNKRTSALFQIDGVTHCASEWAEKLNLTWQQFAYRYRKNRISNESNIFI